VQRIPSPAGATISYERYGSGPPLVLVRGFSKIVDACCMQHLWRAPR
jgi:hypothetical protein